MDLTHDPLNGIDCYDIYQKIQADPRVKYVIFHGKIWSVTHGQTKYEGINQPEHHLHISIKEGCGNDTSPWFPWLGSVKTIAKVKAAVKPLPKKG